MHQELGSALATAKSFNGQDRIFFGDPKATSGDLTVSDLSSLHKKVYPELGKRDNNYICYYDPTDQNSITMMVQIDMSLIKLRKIR